MTTSAKSLILTPEKNTRPKSATKAYARARTQHRIHSLLLDLFSQSKLTQAELARMSDKAPAVINRMIAMPGNHTLNLISDVLFALGAELSDEVARPFAEPARNIGEPSWLAWPARAEKPTGRRDLPITPRAETSNPTKLEIYENV